MLCTESSFLYWHKELSTHRAGVLPSCVMYRVQLSLLAQGTFHTQSRGSSLVCYVQSPAFSTGTRNFPHTEPGFYPRVLCTESSFLYWHKELSTHRAGVLPSCVMYRVQLSLLAQGTFHTQSRGSTLVCYVQSPAFSTGTRNFPHTEPGFYPRVLCTESSFLYWHKELSTHRAGVLASCVMYRVQLSLLAQGTFHTQSRGSSLVCYVQSPAFSTGTRNFPHTEPGF